MGILAPHPGQADPSLVRTVEKIKRGIGVRTCKHWAVMLNAQKLVNERRTDRSLSYDQIVLNAMASSVLVIDGEVRIRFVNSAAEQLLEEPQRARAPPAGRPAAVRQPAVRSGPARAGGGAQRIRLRRRSAVQPGCSALGRPARLAPARDAQRHPRGPASVLGRAPAQSPAGLPGRRARWRAGGNAGARGQEPLVRDPGRGAAARGERRRGRAPADPADLRGDRPHLRSGRPHGAVRRRR